MQHIYQPVMLLQLLNTGGRCSDEEIAKQFILNDPTQIDYYRKVTNAMPGKVLQKHGVVCRESRSNLYELNGYKKLTSEQKERLRALCVEKLDEFVEKQGNTIYDQRKVDTGYVSGTIPYEAFKRASEK